MHSAKRIIIILGLALMGFILEPIVFLARAEEKNKAKPVADKETMRISKPTVEYTATGLKDPFRLFQAPKETKKLEAIDIPVNPPELNISGLVWGAENPQAIINGKVFRIGDTIENARIESIGKNGVVVAFQGKKFTIPVAMNTAYINNNSKRQEPVSVRNNTSQSISMGGPQGVSQGGKNAK